MPQSLPLKLSLLLIAVLGIVGLAAAESKPERFQMNRDIRVEPGESTSDVTCLNCSIHIAGQVAGEATAIHGNVIIESGASVSGDVTTILGDIRIASAANVGGEVTTVGGAVRRQPQAVVAGDVTSMEGTAWVLLIILSPLLVLVLIIAAIIALLQRGRRRPATAAV